MRQALEALEYLNVTAEHRVDDRIPDAAIVALRAALMEPVVVQEQEQERVVWECKAGGLKPLSQRLYDLQPDNIKRHYTRIPHREWQGLTREETLQILDNTLEGGDLMDVAIAIEAALKERNHD
jgi:hypothetical protein